MGLDRSKTKPSARILRSQKGGTVMEWLLFTILFALYVTCLFTVCVLTFRKGHTALGIIGIFFPFLWLVGAVIPSKPGSSYDRMEQARLNSI
jgi:hypothetical protein